MNILLATNAMNVGGIETNNVRLARELTERGHRVLVVSAGGKLVGDLEAAGGEHVWAPLAGDPGSGTTRKTQGGVGDLLRSARIIRRVVDEEDIDVIHSFSTPAGLATWLALLGRRLLRRTIPLVVSSRMGLLRRPDEPYWRVVLRGWLGTFGSRWVIIMSPAIRATLRWMPVRRRRLVDMFVVGVDLPDPEEIDREAHRASVREELGLAPDQKIVLTAGSLSMHKGHDLFIRAVGHLAPEVDDDTVFLLAGGGPLLELHQQWIADAGVTDRLRMIGERRDFVRVMAAADIYVRPGSVEGGVGTTLLDAQAIGVPVVAFDTADVRDAVQDGVTGLLAPPYDEPGLAKAVLQLLRDPDYAASLAAAARVSVHRHGITAVSDSLEALYARGIGLPPPAPRAAMELVLSRRSPGHRPAPPVDDEFWGGIDVPLDFAMVGAAKSGTSWLYGLLRQHPDVFIPNEQNFFTTHRAKGAGYYNGVFRGQPSGVLLGDYSNSYMIDGALPEVLATRWPDLQLILVCRHPAARAFSHYLMDLRHGDLSPGTTFEQALASPPVFSYYDMGLYLHHIRRWLEHFDRERLLVLLFDDLVADPEGTARRVFEFLGVDAGFEVDREASNRNEAETQRFHNHPLVRRVRRSLVSRMSDRLRRVLEPLYFRALRRTFGRRSGPRPQMAPATRAKLVEAYRVPNAELAEFLGVDLSHWDR